MTFINLTPHGRNPLEAGQKFNNISRINEKEDAGRNPLEAGQKFNVTFEEQGQDEEAVAIPLKRGKSSTGGCESA